MQNEDTRTHMDASAPIDAASQLIESGQWREQPIDEIKAILSPAIARVFWVTRHLHPGYQMIRIRVNTSEYTYSSWEMTYKPECFNQSLQRASTPNKGMFYATSCERRRDDSTPYTDTDFGLLMALLETLPELRKECKVTFRPKPQWPLLNPAL